MNGGMRMTMRATHALNMCKLLHPLFHVIYYNILGSTHIFQNFSPQLLYKYLSHHFLYSSPRFPSMRKTTSQIRGVMPLRLDDYVAWQKGHILVSQLCILCFWNDLAENSSSHENAPVSCPAAGCRPDGQPRILDGPQCMSWGHTCPGLSPASD